MRRLWPLALILASAGMSDERFATRVVDHHGLTSGAPFYNNTAAALGKPTTWVRDTQHGGALERVAASLAYATWNTAPDGSPLLVTIPNGAALTVEFDPPIIDDPRHWYAMDLIVYGNAFFPLGQVTWQTNMGSLRFPSSPALFAEPVTVSVSPNGLDWYTYDTPTADGLWPTQSFQWDGSAWAEESDWTKPAPPALTAAHLAGKTVAEAIALLDGSAGGTAFDLSASGFDAIRYVRVTSNGGEVDGFARVSRGPFKRGDVNFDGFVNLDDYFDLADAYRSRPFDPHWNAGADLDGNGFVDLDDYFELADHYRT